MILYHIKINESLHRSFIVDIGKYNIMAEQVSDDIKRSIKEESLKQLSVSYYLLILLVECSHKTYATSKYACISLIIT